MRNSGKRPVRDAELNVLGLIDQIYAAGLDAELWPRALQGLAEATDSVTANVTLFDAAVDRAEVAWHFGGDPALRPVYEGHWAAHNPYLQAGIPLLRTGAVIQGESLIPDAVAKRSAYFNEFLKRARVWYHTGVCMAWEEAFRATLFLSRAMDRPSHSADDIALIRAVTPHLERAMVIQRRLRGVELERSAGEAALDRLPFGVIMLGAGGHVRSHNAAAGEILSQRDGLSCGRLGLEISSGSHAPALRRIVASACGPTTVGSAGGWLQVPRPSGRRAFVLFFAPLRLPDRVLGLDAPVAIAFVSDPERAPEALDQALARLYGLTPAEGRVVAQLAAGTSVADLAEHLGITQYTARTHLKRIFDKMDVRSQAQLVRALLSGLSGLRTSGG